MTRRGQECPFSDPFHSLPSYYVFEKKRSYQKWVITVERLPCLRLRSIKRELENRESPRVKTPRRRVIRDYLHYKIPTDELREESGKDR